MRDCTDCEISLHYNSQPVIESSSSLTFSAFANVGYPQLMGQFQKLKMDVWNNHWSEIHDFTKKSGQVHYTLTEGPSFQIEWQKALTETELQKSEAVVPKTTGELLKATEIKQIICIVSTQYLILHEIQLLRQIIDRSIVAKRIFKGKLPSQVYQMVQSSFPTQKVTDQSICFLFEESNGVENVKKFKEVRQQENDQYVKLEDKQTVTKISPLLFVSFKDQH